MTVMAGEIYKTFSINQSMNFFEGSSGESNTPLGETGPGPTTFEGGDEQAGFYGEMPVGKLFSGDELASEIGLTAGTAQHSNAPWLKFAYEEKLLYVAKKTYRHSISWDNINVVNAVYGNSNGASVSQNGNTYKVRLLRCASNEPTGWDTGVSSYDPNEGKDSEWNDLIYRVHQTMPSNQQGENWFNYTDSDLIMGYGYGIRTWCQEKPLYNSSRRVNRGYTLSYFYSPSSSLSYSYYGAWRPVLELQ